MTTINIDASDFDKKANKLRGGAARVGGALNRLLRFVGHVYTPAVKIETPRRSGKLANSSRFQILGGTQQSRLEVRQSARSARGDFYGHYVRKGTRPHIIRPVNAKALRFVIGGRVIFAKLVRHPGTKPNPYHERALQKVSGRIRGEQNRILEQLAKDLS